MITQSGKIYSRALASIHASGFEALANAATEVVISRRLPAGSLVLDLGCGAGPLSAVLVEQGLKVWGADTSPEFIDKAQTRVPQGTFILGSVHELELPNASAVCAVGEIFNYVAPRHEGKTSLAKIFEKVHSSLPVGGLFLFDLSEPGRAAGGVSRYTEGDDWAVGMSASEQGTKLVREISSFVKNPDGTWNQFKEVHTLHLFDQDTVIRALAESGFDVATSDSYGEAELPPHHIRYDAVKR